MANLRSDWVARQALFRADQRETSLNTVTPPRSRVPSTEDQEEPGQVAPATHIRPAGPAELTAASAAPDGQPVQASTAPEQARPAPRDASPRRGSGSQRSSVSLGNPDKRFLSSIFADEPPRKRAAQAKSTYYNTVTKRPPTKISDAVKLLEDVTPARHFRADVLPRVQDQIDASSIESATWLEDFKAEGDTSKGLPNGVPIEWLQTMMRKVSLS